MAKTHRPKRTDPAVRLSPERLRAAIEYKRLTLGVDTLSVRAVAKAVFPGDADSFRVRLQNAYNGQRGACGACSASEREALAAYLGEPMTGKWLGAEQDIEWSWFPGHKQLDMNLHRLPDTQADHLEVLRLARTLQNGSRALDSQVPRQIGRRVRKTRKKRRLAQVTTPQPPLYQLIAWRLARDIEAAWDGAHRSEGLEPTLYPGPPVQILLSLASWRRLLFEHEASWGTTTDVSGAIKEAPTRRIAGIILTNEAEADEFAAGVATAVRILLRPWLHQREEIPDNRVKAVLSLIRSVGTMKPSDIDRAVRRGERSGRRRHTRNPV